MKSLVWLASYPKSGNTWLRMLFANYLVNAAKPVPINQLERIGTGDGVARLYRSAAGGRFDPANDRLALSLRPRVLHALAGNGADVNLLKTHNIQKKIDGLRLIPPELTRRGIYIIRNPLDMLVSYADHYGVDHARAATEINDPGTTLLPTEHEVRQYLGTWSDHVRSWTRNPGFSVTVIRYEDLMADPVATFSKVLRDLGAPLDDARLAKAVEFSSFNTARAQEESSGFIERSTNSTRFFRSGKTGEGERVLDPAIVDKVKSDHEKTMQRHGYLT